MLTIQSLLISAVLAAPSDTVLLEFTSDSCVYCDQMKPTVRRLETDGLPVKQINISRNPSWGDHYQISGVPTYVMLANGREVGRVVGRTSYDRLARLFEIAGVRPGGNQVPRDRPAPRGNPIEAKYEQPQTQFVSAPRSNADRVRATEHTGRLDAEKAALAATVRIGVEDDRYRDFATGTIIDVHGDEALVLTCGHVFRDSGGRGRITVDVFSGGKTHKVPGKLIDYVSEKGDIGLVAFRPPISVKAVPVAPPDFRPQRGDAAFTVGCDGGKPPSLRHSKITFVNRYNGSPPNIEAAGVPVKGRSGGGLFTADGRLIGVCNAADDDLREGVYASLPQVYQRLDKIGLKQIYQRGDHQLADNAKTAIRPEKHHPRNGGELLVNNERRDDRLTPVSTNRAPDLEVICIIRPRNDPSASRTIVLENPPSNLVDNLRSEYQRQLSSRSPKSRSPLFTTSASQPRNDLRSDANVVRGQSK